jgi:HK97 family phage prohead protease
MMADEIKQSQPVPYADPAIRDSEKEPPVDPLAVDDPDLVPVAPVEMRSAGVAIDDVDFKERTITVVAVPYERPAMVEYRHAVWQEVFSRSAFNGIEKRQKSIIPASAQLNTVAGGHDHTGSRLIGRVVSAYPDSEPGLITDIKVSKTDAGDETLQLAADHVLHPSVGFRMGNPHRDQQLDRSTMTRRINRAFLDHLAFVGVPAYPDAKVLAVRSAAATSESDLPPMAQTPRMDEFLDDPFVRQALGLS